MGFPDPVELAEQVRWLADPAVAVVVLSENLTDIRRGVLVSCDEVREGMGFALRDWLERVDEICLLDVPYGIERHFQALRAIVVPMWTPAWKAGVIALPMVAGRWNQVATQLTHLGAEFALRLESCDRQAAIAELDREQQAEREARRPPPRKSGLRPRRPRARELTVTPALPQVAPVGVSLPRVRRVG